MTDTLNLVLPKPYVLTDEQPVESLPTPPPAMPPSRGLPVGSFAPGIDQNVDPTGEPPIPWPPATPPDVLPIKP